MKKLSIFLVISILLIVSACDLITTLEQPKYKVTYTGNGNTSGAVPIDNKEYSDNSEVTLLDNINSLEKENFVFSGWSVMVDGNQIVYQPGDKVKIANSNLNFSAVWTNTYIVSFESNQGSFINNQNIISGGKIIEPQSPVRENYTFSGWYNNQDFSKKWDFDNDTVTSNIVLYAKWEMKPSYTVTFNTNSNSSITSISVIEGEFILEPVSPVKENYNFNGWYKESNFITLWDFDIDTVKKDITLYAKWDNKPTYTVNFNTNTDTPISSILVIEGNSIQEPNIPTKENHNFNGWYSDETFTNPWNFNDSINKNINLYAKWELNPTYIVKFVTNTNVTIDDQSVFLGKKVSEPNDPSKSTFTFEGWYSDENFNNKWDFVNGTVTQNITLYAKWNQLQTFTVTFNTDGGSSVNTRTLYDGDLIPIPTEPVKNNYSFVAWYSDSNLNNLWNFNSDTITSNIILFAKWTMLPTYNVTFDYGEIGSLTVIQGNKIEKPLSPQREGYTFVNWYKDSSFLELWDFNNHTVNTDIDLFGKWEINKYDITFYTDNESSIPSQQIQYGSKIDKPITPVKTGYTFVDWYSDSSHTKMWDFNNTVSSNQNLYAKWNINSYTITFEANGGSSVSSQSIVYLEKSSKPSNPVKEGFTFENWYSDADLSNLWDFNTQITTTLKLYANWSLNNYTVSFDSKGGSLINNQYIDHNKTAQEPTIPTKDGYTFIGWYEDRNLTIKWDFVNNVITSTKTLYANWELTKHQVSFNSNSGSQVESQDIIPGEKVTKPDDPTRTGYSFVAWYKDSDFLELWNFDNDIVSSNQVIYAKWIKTYQVTFNSNPGSQVNSQIIIEGEKAVKPNNPTREGHTFSGWYKDEGLFQTWDFNTETITADSVLFAKWNINSYTIVFVRNGGSYVSSQSITYGNKINTFTEPTKDGFTFAGWFRESSFTNQWDLINDVVVDHTYLYAKWNPLPNYTVTFNSDGGELVDSQTTYENNVISKPTDPYKKGFGFVGWFKEQELTNAWDFNTDRISSNITLHAKWEALPSFTVTYNSNGGSVVDSESVFLNDPPTLPTSPEKSGYIFVHWYKDSTLKIRFDFTEDKITENITLYARWIDPSNINYTELVNVTGGTFTQRDTAGQVFEHTVSSFLIGKYEVTYELWYYVYTWANNNGYNIVNAGYEGTLDILNEPLRSITWWDAIVWCNAYSELKGYTPVYYDNSNNILKDSSSSNSSILNYPVVNWSANGYRLPTEGEWQFTASNRGANSHENPSGSLYPYDNDEETAKVAWCSNNSNYTLYDIGTKNANELGVYDMSGSVWEFCFDWMNDLPTTPQTDFRGTRLDNDRVIKGGSFAYSSYYARTGYRIYYEPNKATGDKGFRVARSSE